MPQLSPENKRPHFTADTWTTSRAKCSQTLHPFRGKYTIQEEPCTLISEDGVPFSDCTPSSCLSTTLLDKCAENPKVNLLKVFLGRGGLVNVTDGAVVCPGRAVGAVPRVVAVDPRQLAGEGGEEVEQGPGDDDVVVEAHVEGNEDDCKAYTCQMFIKAGIRRN